MRTIVCIIALFTAILGPHGISDAKEEPYCGLYSMHAALHALDLEPDFNAMVFPKYLSGTDGSTARDLIDLAKEFGGAATFRPRMTLADLRAATSPVVLHTSVAIAKSGFHHWVLFLGMDGKSVRLYDPPKGEYTLSTAELMSHWDGAGVIVHRADIRPRALVIDFELILAFLVTIVVGGVANSVDPVARRFVLNILLIAAISGLTWHSIVDYGFFGNEPSLMNVASRHDRDILPTVDVRQMRNLAQQDDVTIVDARRPSAFEESHIPGAINIPITVTHGFLRDVLKEIPVDNHIVVYCQSDDCDWADSIGHQFPVRGYRRVSIFRDGMDGWASNDPHTDIKKG